MNINNKSFKTVIVGFGKLGLLHLSQFSAHPDVEVIGICENEKTMNKILNKNFKDLKIFHNYKDLINLNLDFITICTPTGSHFEIIKFFLEHKIPIFSEKPLAANYKEARDLKNLSNQYKTLLFVGYMYEFYETFQKAYELVNTKKILGEIIYSKGEMYVSQVLKKPNKSNWRFIKKKSGGGVLITQTSHLIYIMQKFFGEYESCYGFCKSIYSDENEDYAHLVIRTKSGVICNIDASWSVINYRVPQLKFFIEGTNGSILVNEDKIELNLKESIASINSGMSIISKMELFKNSFYNVAGNHYAHQSDFFIDLLKSNTDHHQNLDHSVNVNKIIEEVYNQ
tara:strand:+ start:9544 stop:10563 length:1020 start_codon:yes stop_codon:yes gene_type:complete